MIRLRSCFGLFRSKAGKAEELYNAPSLCLIIDAFLSISLVMLGVAAKKLALTAFLRINVTDGCKLKPNQAMIL